MNYSELLYSKWDIIKNLATCLPLDGAVSLLSGSVNYKSLVSAIKELYSF
jgi:hypothetical protein